MFFESRPRIPQTATETPFTPAQREELLKGIFESSYGPSVVREATYPRDKVVAGFVISFGFEVAIYVRAFKKAMPFLFTDAAGVIYTNSDKALGWLSLECDRVLGETFIYCGGELDAVYSAESESSDKTGKRFRPQWDRS